MPTRNAPINVRLRGEQSKGRLAVMENRVSTDFAGPPLHVHPDFDETFYVLEGELTFQLQNERRTAGPGAVPALSRRSSPGDSRARPARARPPRRR